MTVYATIADFTSRFGDEETLQLCHKLVDASNVIDAPTLVQTLRDASAEVDSYIAVRYPLDLLAARTEFPEPLTRAVCDIARYFLYKDSPTEQVAQRYKEVTTWLLNVSKGAILLNFVPALTTTELQEAIFQPAPAVGLVDGGVFGRAMLNLMPEVCPLGPEVVGYVNGVPLVFRR